MSTYAEGVESPYVFQGIGAFEIAFEKMEKDLKAGGPWLVGANLTLADINMMPFVARMDFMDLLDVWIADRPTAQDWWRRVRHGEELHTRSQYRTEDAAGNNLRGGWHGPAARPRRPPVRRDGNERRRFRLHHRSAQLRRRSRASSPSPTRSCPSSGSSSCRARFRRSAPPPCT